MNTASESPNRSPEGRALAIAPLSIAEINALNLLAWLTKGSEVQAIYRQKRLLPANYRRAIDDFLVLADVVPLREVDLKAAWKQLALALIEN
jgi:hypothetical protein